MSLSFQQLTSSDPSLAHLAAVCGRTALQQHADTLRKALRKQNYTRPLDLVGGSAFQNEELPQNTFGSTVVGDYGYIFNPTSPEERAYIVRNAYIASHRRQRFVEPIDRLIRAAAMPAMTKIRAIEDTSQPAELTEVLREGRSLENQILLLVGSVGAGEIDVRRLP